MEGRFTQRLGSSGVSLCFPGLPGIISEKAPVVFFSVCDCVPAKHGITPKIFGGSLSSVKHPSMLEHSLRLVLTQGIQGDHLPPFRPAGFQDNWWQLIFRRESTRGGHRAPLYSLPRRNSVIVCFYSTGLIVSIFHCAFNSQVFKPWILCM